MDHYAIAAARAGVAAALAKARKHVGAAAMVAALVPVGVLAGTSGAWASLAPTTPTVSAPTITQNGNVFDWTYQISLASGPYPNVSALEIPDVGAAFLVSGTTLLGTPSSGWTGTVVTTATLSGPTLKDGTVPAAWLDLTTSTNPITAGGSLTFTLESALNTAVSANIAYGTPGSYSGTIDPPIPGSVPEPASLPVLGAGLLGLLAVRRRKRA